jgi:MFS transporter, FHS family, glucose/mannose:H+ symporter
MKEPPLGLLSFGFVVCGIVTVLPGPLLPLFAARWGLPDVQSGAFFAAEFTASTIAAILSPRRMRWSLPRGYALISVGVFLLAVAGRAISPSTGHALALGAFTLIGFGIGLSVTATNLIVGAAPVAERARRLSIVNLWWGFGAVACPWLVAEVEHAGDLRLLFALVGFCATGMFIVLLPLREEPRAPSTSSSLGSDAIVLAYFALLLFLYVGVENAVGGWIATYTHRFNNMTLAHASLMVSFYWLALLGGRGVGSLALRRFPERVVLIPGLAIALTAVAVLIAPRPELTVVGAIFLAGFGFGPVFPIGVSRMLSRVIDNRNTGWVFATCASGGAVLPWVTGMVSTHWGSLRLGFAVPVAALAIILLLALAENLILQDALALPPEKQDA